MNYTHPRVIAWHRVSVDENTLDEGVKRIEDYISKNLSLHPVSRHYWQESGIKDQRPRWDNFIEEVNNTQIPIVIIDDWYNLGHKNCSKQQFWKLLLEKKKGRLIVVLRNKDTAYHDFKLEYDIMAAVDEDFAVKRARGCAYGQQKKRELDKKYKDDCAKLGVAIDRTRLYYPGRAPGSKNLNHKKPTLKAIAQYHRSHSRFTVETAREMGVSRMQVWRALKQYPETAALQPPQALKSKKGGDRTPKASTPSE